MIFSSFGPYCPLTEWGIDLIRAIIRTAFTEPDFIAHPEKAGIQAAWDNRSKSVALIFADCPERSVVDIFLRTQAPLVLFAESPIELVKQTIAGRNLDFKAAIRVISQCSASLHDLFLQPQSLIITRSNVSVESLIESIANHYSIELSRTQIRSLAGQFSGDNCLTVSEVIDGVLAQKKLASLPSLSPEEIRIVNDVIEPAFRCCRGEPANQFTWPTGLFYNGNKPDTYVFGEIKLLGPARSVLYGPYLHLPCGRWISECSISVRGGELGNDLIVDVYSDSVTFMAETKLLANGDFGFAVPIEVKEPRTPLQIRLLLKTGAIGGALRFNGVNIFRADEKSVPLHS